MPGSQVLLLIEVVEATVAENGMDCQNCDSYLTDWFTCQCQRARRSLNATCFPPFQGSEDGEERPQRKPSVISPQERCVAASKGK
jgi:hypothetical protein